MVECVHLSIVSMNDEILIRLSEDGFGFIYSVRRGVDLIESAVVDHTGPQRSEEPLDGYYGGSEVMD